ncbi:MAG: hypothetical protein F6K11_06555 [Leptolyngbya sp. SIO3F4]|nr:hypothetical protein [Leptolyngbya sp. SIO3F4]
MTLAMKTGSLLAVIVILAGILVGYRHGDQELCISRTPTFDGEGPGYELLNLADGDVWATRDWSPEEYTAFSLPGSWSFWHKNDPRIVLADQGRFLQSPGCENGQYSYMQAFDREFLQVVQLKKFPTDDQDLIRQVDLEKYHVLQYSAGRTISILQSPTGQRFIGVSRSLDRSAEKPMLPEGWTLTEHLLTTELQVDLLGRVSVLRLDNKDSYQGPLSQEIIL